MGNIVINPLIEVLSSEVKDVRASAVWALSKVGDAAIPALIDKMDDPEKNIRESAIWGLSKIGAPALKLLAERWNVRIGKEAMEGEDETSSVDIDDLVSGGENKIKEWIKFMVDKRHPKEPGSEDELKSSPSESSAEMNETIVKDSEEKPEESSEEPAPTEKETSSDD
jgi:hypothetical protein